MACGSTARTTDLNPHAQPAALGRDRPVWQAVGATAFSTGLQLPQVAGATVLMPVHHHGPPPPQGGGAALPGLPVSDNTGTFYEWLSTAANLE